METVGNLLIVFGGHAFAGGGKFNYFKDTYALDCDTLRWHAPSCAGGRAPAARYGHASAVIEVSF